MTKIDLVVVTYNSGHELEGFLDSLDVLADADLRVFVTDNASTDDTVARARAHPHPVEIIETGANLGYAAAINLAMRRFDDDALAVIANPDIRLQPGFLDPVLAVAGEPGVGVVTTMLIDDRGTPLPSLRRDPSVRRSLAEALVGGRLAARLGLGEVIVDPDAYRRSSDAEWGVGALLVVTPACRRQVGAWDESFFLYSEETDFQLRVRRAGLRVRYTPDAVAFHRGGASHVNPALWSTLTSNRVRLFRRYHGRLHTVGFWLAVLLNEVLRMSRSATHRRAARDLTRGFRSLVT